MAKKLGTNEKKAIKVVRASAITRGQEVMMGWVPTSTRRSRRLAPVDADDDEDLINGFACYAEIQAFRIECPGCGAAYAVRASDRHPRVFNRRTQRFRCTRCRFAAPVYVIVDCGFAPEEPEPQGRGAP